MSNPYDFGTAQNRRHAIMTASLLAGSAPISSRDGIALARHAHSGWTDLTKTVDWRSTSAYRVDGAARPLRRAAELLRPVLVMLGFRAVWIGGRLARIVEACAWAESRSLTAPACGWHAYRLETAAIALRAARMDRLGWWPCAADMDLVYGYSARYDVRRGR